MKYTRLFFVLLLFSGCSSAVEKERMHDSLEADRIADSLMKDTLSVYRAHPDSAGSEQQELNK